MTCGRRFHSPALWTLDMPTGTVGGKILLSGSDLAVSALLYILRVFFFSRWLWRSVGALAAVWLERRRDLWDSN